MAVVVVVAVAVVAVVVVVAAAAAAALVVQRCHCRQRRSRSSFPSPNRVRYVVSSIRQTSNVCAQSARRDSCRRRRRPNVRGEEPDDLSAATNAV